MKRVFALLMTVVLLAGVLSVDGFVAVDAAASMAGDVNGDGKLNNRDLGLLQQALGDWDVTVVGNADVNGDGRVNNRDLGYLQQVLSGGGQIPGGSIDSYVDLGAPAAAYYPSNYLARCAWDMTIFDGRLYVGCGDYSNNSGDVPVLSCSLNDLGNWTVEAILPVLWITTAC